MRGEIGRRVRINSPIADGVIGNLAELGGDIAGLADLQVRLAVADVKTSASRAALPVALIASGGVFVLSALPVALIGASELLADGMQLAHRGWAYLIVAGGMAAIAAILAFIGIPRLMKSFDTLVRSKEELARNVAWIKTVLANSGRPPAHRRNGNGNGA